MRKRGKRYTKLKSDIEKAKTYKIEEAIKHIKGKNSVKFDETLDIAINLGIDPKQSDQVIRGLVTLPNGTGKILKIAVFVKDNRAQEAIDAGADFVGQEDLGEKIQKNKVKVDVVIASPDMMSVVGKFGKVLGPKGLMPNPKMGTVTNEIEKKLRTLKKDRLNLRPIKLGLFILDLGK